MDEGVAGQLERLYERIEFNDDFELDIIAPRTWLAEWQARFELEQGLAGRAEWLVLSLSPEQDVLEPGRQLVDLFERGAGRRLLVVHVRDEGDDPRRWQPFFRRLNEIRNAVVRELQGNLVLLIAASLVTEFAGEAPDTWSVGAVMVVGTWTQAWLDDQLCAHVPALVALTRKSTEEGLAMAAAIGEAWPPALSQSSPNTRARQLFELLLQFDPAALDGLDVQPELMAPSHRLTYSGGRLYFAGFPMVREASGIICKASLDSIDARPRLMKQMQSAARYRFRVLHVEHTGPLCSANLALARLGFDLVVLESSNAGWRVQCGDARQAPLLEVSRQLMPVVDIAIAVARRTEAHVWLTLESRYRWESPQMWLPGIEHSDLGAMPLYCSLKPTTRT